MDFWFLIIATCFFLGGFLFSAAALRSGTYHHNQFNLLVIGAGFLFQCGFLYLRGQLHGRCPIMNGTEILVFIAWSLAIMYFALGRTFRLSLVGTFTAPILVILHVLALVLNFLQPVTPRPAATVDPWLEMHAATSLLAYGAFALAAISGVMYLVQNRQLKSGRPGFLSFNLPPIRYLSSALVRLIVIGWLLLSAGIVCAFFMKTSPAASHLGVSLGVWLVYTTLLGLHWLRNPAARWLSLASVIAFALALVSLFAL